MKVLVIGPSDTRSKGGMATVIADMRSSRVIEDELSFHESFIDGSSVTRLLFSAKAYLKFCSIYRSYDAFHIHVASNGSTFRKMQYLKKIKKAGKRCMVHIHGARYVEFYNSLPESRKKQVVEFLKSADMVIALSEEWKNKFEKLFGLENCEALPNGIRVEDYAKAVSYENPDNYVMLGRLGERKGTYELVDAVAQVAREKPGITVTLAGDGEIEKVREYIEKRNLQNHFRLTGWLDEKEKMAVLKESSVMILPSHNEGLPMAILEGMAAGKAIISTTVGAIPEVVKPENGILITPGNMSALAKAMLSLDKKRIREMGEANIEKVRKEFSTEVMHKRLNELYRKAFDN